MINVRKILVALSLILFLTQITTAQNLQKEADVIIGTWMMPNNEGVIEIFKEGEYYNGKIVFMKKTEEDGTPLKDKENPADSLRNRDVVGLQVMNGFEYEGNNVWSGGTFYAARKGKEVEPDFVLVNKNQLNIEISFFVFSKTVELTRVDSTEYFKNKNKAVK